MFVAEFPLVGGGGEPVDFARTIVSHARTLETTLPVPRGARTVRIATTDGKLRIEAVSGGAQARAALERTCAHMFRLDEDLSGFYTLVSEDGELGWCALGAGRMLRAPTVFEDVVKTNCTLIRRLPQRIGGRFNARGDSVARVKVTAEAARRFLFARHFLAPARSLAGGLDGVLEVFRKFGSIQFDPIAVAGRNHDLVLHARVAGYEPAWCDVLYERREIFEATNKALSFVPTSEFPWFRHVMGRKGPLFHNAALAENAAVAERVLEGIRAEGPLSSRDFEGEAGATKDWFGMPENAVRAVLEAYTVTGVFGLARRDGNLRYYDLLERLLPAEMLAYNVPEREQLRHKMLSRYRAHGLLGLGGAGGTFDRIAEPSARNELRKELVAAGSLVPVEVEGVRGKRLVLDEELELLEAPPESTPSVAFIAPFDSLLWDTALLSTLFAFDYVWEGFFRAAKRRWGYYVLPIVFGDRFVGRIEPRIDRDRALVEVLNVWWEDGFTPRRADGFIDAMRNALRAYLRFADADRLEWAPHLATEKRLFLTRP